MHSPLHALCWEIWRRNRRSAWLSLSCVILCALINLLVPASLRTAESTREIFNTLFGLLMTVSLLLTLGIFNYTEYSSSREWNGFPYRLFTLPVRTWRLVALPMLLAVVSIELLYWAWVKLVWTREPFLNSEWFAVVLGAYAIFYLAALWSLAGFRIVRLLGLSLGGVSSVGVACLPFSREIVHSPWLGEKRLIFTLIMLAALAFVIAWTAVARQRCGGGQRRHWLKRVLDFIGDLAPRRTRNFSSPAAAQFWFEWRRSGLLLPACTLLILVAIFCPVSWFFRHNPDTTYYVLMRLVIAPLVLAFAIGKAFIKPEFWSMDLALPSFLAVRPVVSEELVIAKMKAAALSAAITWLLVIGFIALWLPLWADPLSVRKLFFGFHMLYPHTWPLLSGAFFAILAVLTWRCLVTDLWIGLSGKRSWYIGWMCLQVIIPSLLLIVAALFSDKIDTFAKARPNFFEFQAITLLGWLLALLVIIKYWSLVFIGSKISSRRTGQYLLVWSAATVFFVVIALLGREWGDMYRTERIFLLAALLLMPLARLGLAPASLARNRHR